MKPTDATLDWLPFLLQTGDALFPTGAYAHSTGLEELVRLNVVSDESSLLQFLHLQILPALRNCDLPYLRFAFDAASAEEVLDLCAIDRELSSWKLPVEARSGSIQIGNQRLKALCGICDSHFVHAFAMRVANGLTPGHHLAVCALQAASGKIPLNAALASHAYQSLASACACAMKLIRIGQSGCQRVLRAAAAKIDAAVAGSLLIAREDAGWFNPILEIAAMRHEYAHERLFIS